jgi:hypothetical protein
MSRKVVMALLILGEEQMIGYRPGYSRR